uniref:Isoform A of Ethanolamine kinase n=1 Tax=Drosophila melanogaster TaxID=7227 RepID=P54352-2|nr:easily shocked, isoform A [Drosophila melanogaster]NP_727941.2 easily shocked, isoform I [Drosophila melanogaster]NP_727942.1 easily shocked, isoform B [Drosophila melanogaster]NP_727943.1 easily shocked, isoform C [Drosophila melanogaster]NP_788914.2 easily shocked, isoform H [Drosophila melanogaster]AOQ13769.1 eas-PA [synthetic construct]AAC37210.1 ethanolamine kinase [Drosophila melanogaster]AAF48574.1 easily shocked, isoform A [Drosophila melanogaster]AAF48575.2 easily shocked, isofo|eukprot:NP_523364.2 easily shocked, isoform A [Drosophila melanogaster]
MGTETKSNSYTGQISTSGGNPKVMKDSLSLVRQTVNQQTLSLSQSNQVQNQLNSHSNSNSYPNPSGSENKNENEQNSRDIRAKPEDKSRKEAIVPFVPIFVEEADVIQGAKELLKVIRPTWDLSHVEFKSFTDGITNKLVGCFHKEISKLNDENGGSYLPIKTQGLSPVQSEDPVIIEKEDDDEFTDDRAADDGSPVQYSDNVVLVRIYGNKTDLLIDRKAETQNFLLLHTYGLAPSLYATFKNGLVYEYVPGTTLNTDSVLCPEIWPLVARRMAEMHRKVRKHGDSSATKPMPMIWKKTQSFLDLVPERFSDAEKHKRVKETFLPIGRLREEFNKLYEYLEALDSPIVFSHNDLLLGNVIYTQSLNTVNFIDYEYADYNFQAFDIGNHFAEMCGVDEVDYSRYPKREFQLQWLRVYLEEYLQRSNIQNDEVELLYVQVNQFALASHIFWTVWSLLQAEHSTIDFDYVGYAFLRYNEYLARKVEFLSLTAAKNNK